MLHLIRQAGLVSHTKMDLLDERKLTRRECFGLALDLLSPEELSLACLPEVIADIPLVYQPQKKLNHAKEIYYDDHGGVYKPLIAPKALVRASIAQEQSFASRQVFKFRLNVLGHFLPTPSARRQAQEQLAFGAQALELPGQAERSAQERDGVVGNDHDKQMPDGAPPPYAFDPTGDASGYTPKRAP